jgi:ADP-ribose pyrophosphatase YjhB (NUDIX family)
MYLFNVRVYGLLLNEQNHILISDEEEYGFQFSKFPGGGLEYGEGLIEGLKREFIEECETEIEVLEHFYTTDFFIKSVFNESQVISVYYMIKPVSTIDLDFRESRFDFQTNGDVRQAFRWKSIHDLLPDELTFPTDQKVLELLKEKWPKKV